LEFDNEQDSSFLLVLDGWVYGVVVWVLTSFNIGFMKPACFIKWAFRDAKATLNQTSGLAEVILFFGTWVLSICLLQQQGRLN
jgi:hypothetical protein